MSHSRRWRPLLFIGLLACCGHLVGSEPDPVCLDQFAGRNVRFVVNKEAGGGHDQYARLFASVFAGTSGARTRVVNVVGGNGLLGIRAVAAAPPNTLTIGLFERERVFHPLESHQALNADDFRTLGIINIEAAGWIASADFRLEDYRGRELVAAVSDLFPSVSRLAAAARSLDITLRAVSGYAGSADAIAAVSRGEVDVAAYSLTSIIRSSESGELKPVLSLTRGPAPGFEQVPYLAGPGGAVDRLTKNTSLAIRNEAMALADTTALLADSVRALFVSSRIDPALLACTEQLVQRTLFSERFAAVTEAARRQITPMTVADSEALLSTGFSAAVDQADLLAELLAEMMR